MRTLVILGILLLSIQLHSSPMIKVAVIDTGLQLSHFKDIKLCKSGHKDFTGEGFDDINGHGTNIAGLITKYAKNDNYCLIVIKAYSFKTNTKAYITEALTYAYKLGVNIINLSGGGQYPISKERQIVSRILNAKITLIVASGNDHLNLDKSCNFYPACYDKRIYVIGSIGKYSNYGKVVDQVIDGNSRTGFGITLSGSSQSTSIFTGQLLTEIGNLEKDL